jgi:hypothetical protein
MEIRGGCRTFLVQLWWPRFILSRLPFLQENYFESLAPRFRVASLRYRSAPHLI